MANASNKGATPPKPSSQGGYRTAPTQSPRHSGVPKDTEPSSPTQNLRRGEKRSGIGSSGKGFR